MSWKPTTRSKAIELVKKGSFDVIFAEFNTTGGASEEMLKTFRKMNAKVPIIVTAPADAERRRAEEDVPDRVDLPDDAVHDRAASQDGFAIRSVDCRLKRSSAKELAIRAVRRGWLFLFAVGPIVARG